MRHLLNSLLINSLSRLRNLSLDRRGQVNSLKRVLVVTVFAAHYLLQNTVGVVEFVTIGLSLNVICRDELAKLLKFKWVFKLE